MNRCQRRAEAAKRRSAPAAMSDAGAIRLTLDYLANAAAPTATGATLFTPDGKTVYLSAEDARALHGRDTPTRGRA